MSSGIAVEWGVLTTRDAFDLWLDDLERQGWGCANAREGMRLLLLEDGETEHIKLKDLKGLVDRGDRVTLQLWRSEEHDLLCDFETTVEGRFKTSYSFNGLSTSSKCMVIEMLLRRLARRAPGDGPSGFFVDDAGDLTMPIWEQRIMAGNLSDLPYLPQAIAVDESMFPTIRAAVRGFEVKILERSVFCYRPDLSLGRIAGVCVKG